jgi:cold shock CspA family protein
MSTDDLSIRRPDLLDVLRLASVRWWKDDKGYGRITADDGVVLFISFAHLVMDGYRGLSDGQRVSFVWRGSLAANGRHAAEEVRLIGERQPQPEDAREPDSGAGDW